MDEQETNRILNEISDSQKHEALRYIIIGKDKDLISICNIYETCVVDPSLEDFIKLFDKFLRTNKARKKIDLFKWELFCIDREIPKVEETLKRDIFIVAT